jgi:rRNA-processing protein FCF1
LKKTVILDTNFLIAQFAQRIDVFHELSEMADDHGYAFEFIVPQTVLDELSGISSGKGKRSVNAAGALRLLKGKINGGSVKVVKTGESVDKWILKKAMEKAAGLVVCTNDGALRISLKKLGVKVIVVRERRKLFYS